MCEEPSISESVQASYSSRGVLSAYSARALERRPVAVKYRAEIADDSDIGDALLVHLIAR